MSARPSLGFIGLGVMGAPMTRRLLGQGFRVAVWNRESERAAEVVPQGAVWAGSPAEVRAACEVVLTCVLDGDAMERVCFAADGLAAAADGAALLVDCSTVPPERTRVLAARLAAEAAVSWVDAPVSGGPPLAETGELTILAGGAAADFERARPVLEAMSANLTRMGELGAGQTAKTLNQVIVGVNYVLMAEVLRLAEAAGVDAAALPAALAGGAADSAILQRIFPQMQARDYDPPRAYARQLDKDLQALAAFCAALDVDVPLVATAIRRYAEYVGAGNAMADSAAIGRFYSRHDFRRADSHMQEFAHAQTMHDVCTTHMLRKRVRIAAEDAVRSRSGARSGRRDCTGRASRAR